MRLTKVILWNFRSFWSNDAPSGQGEAPSVVIDLSPGVNYLVGPNNVGKSNLLRAIALALDPHAAYEPVVDRPQTKASGPAIELEFAVTMPADGSVKNLLDAVDAYERAIRGFNAPSLASQGIVRFFVEYSKGGVRDERFLTRGTYEKGDVVGRNNKRQKAVECFHDVVRFVDIQSGEDLQSLLRRGFKEILASAMGAELTDEMTRARDARTAYFEALRQVLRPVAKHVEGRIKGYVPAISEVDLMPNVPSVEDALADVQVYVEDAARTALDQKGTGVRGAMLLLLLSFIADSAKTAVVFGIEEPEAFLHPEAHRILGEELERFTRRDDVTLLATTHSPFVFRSDAGGRDERSAVFVVRKDESGRSSVTKGGAESARMDLLGSRLLTSLLQRGDEVPEKSKLVLVVEGWSDCRYLEIAAQRLDIRLDAVYIVAAGGSIVTARRKPS
ncbi:MAG: AAA family ATPase [Polyangiaceae bacterium]|nr:AAA family ATPase [Polyangiaceae bacterium]